MKNRLIVLLTTFSMILSCIPQAVAADDEKWIISNFSESNGLEVSQKSCTDGIVTISGTADGKYVTACAYSDRNTWDDSTLVGLNQATTGANGAFSLTLGLKDSVTKGYIVLGNSAGNKISAEVIKSSNSALVSELETMKNTLNALVAKCEQAGIPVDYAKVKSTVVDKFTEFLNEDLSNGVTSRVESHFEILTGLYEEAYQELSAYLSGNAIPESVPRYITSSNRDETDGVTVLADTVKDGEIEKRPMFYVGFGHWQYAENSVSYFDDLGLNYLHAETGPNRILFHPDPAKDWEFASGGYLKEGSKVELVAGAGVDGSTAIHIVNTTPRDDTSNTHVYGSIGVQQKIQAKANTSYSYSFKIKSTTIDPASYCVVGSGQRKKLSADGYSNFTTVSGTYTTAADETSFTITVYAENVNDFLLDDFSVKQAWTNINLVSNPGFEEGEGDKTGLRNGFKVKYDEIERLKKVFQNAEDNNVAIALLLSLHYFPSFVTAEDSTIDNDGKVYTAFMPVNPTHPRVQEVFETFVDILMEELGEYKSLQSVVIANEPAFLTGHGGNGNPNSYYVPKFREYLKNKYKTLSAINARYGSSYSSWDEINMPAWGSVRYGTKTKLTVDYVEYNNTVVYDFHKQIADIIKVYNPEIKLHTKIMAYLLPSALNDTNVKAENGNEYVSLSKLFDLNGYDGGAIDHNENATMEQTLQWSDFARSVNDAPMFNTEDHAMSGDYSAEKADWIYGYLWQGALHGKGGTTLWRWNRDDYSMNEYETDTNFAVRPAETASVGKAALDLNRLADKIDLITKREAHVAIYYSDADVIWNNRYLNALYQAYCAVLYTGQKVDYITDYTTSQLNDGDYDLLVVPYATHVPQELLNEIVEFKQKGGKVILTEVDAGTAIASDIYGDAHNSTLVSNAKSGCEVARYSSQSTWEVADDGGTVATAIRNMVNTNVRDAQKLQIKDASTGEALSNIDFAYATDENGDVIVNIYSFEDDLTKNVNVYYNGNKVTSSTDLISKQDMGEVLTLAPYTPLLLNISGTDKEIKTVISLGKKVGEDVEITDYNINALQQGTIVASFEVPQNKFDSQTDAMFVVASYEGGKLTGCSASTLKPSADGQTVKLTLDVASVSEDTTLKTFVWSNVMKPLAQSLVLAG